jgi:hypothetical protein
MDTETSHYPRVGACPWPWSPSLKAIFIALHRGKNIAFREKTVPRDQNSYQKIGKASPFIEGNTLSPMKGNKY